MPQVWRVALLARYRHSPQAGIGALAVAAPGFVLARRQAQPLFAKEAAWPGKTALDRPLIAGAVLFGLGWGLVGLCPGPAIANLGSLSARVIAFVLAMAVGMLALDLWRRARIVPST